MNEIETQILENARSYENSLRDEYVSSSGRYTTWFKYIHKHYQNSIVTEFSKSQERLVDYWPCYVVLEGREDRDTFSGTTTKKYLGKYGSGYICITNSHIRLFIFNQLTQQYPPFTQGAKGFFREILTASLGSPEVYNLTAIRDDKIWTIPFQSILGSEIQTRINARAIELKTAYGKFDILEVFRDNLTKILTAIYMASSGKLSEIWADSQGIYPVSENKNTALLQKLIDLRQAGIITQSEFDEKKAKLLSGL